MSTDLIAPDGTITATPRPGPLRRARLRFRRFRRTRPFWGAILLTAGAYFIANPLLGASWGFLVHLGVKGMTPIFLACAMAAAAGIAVVLPAQRHFPAIIAAMLSVAALPLANLGGWIIGTVLGIVGSGLIFGWAPYTDKQLARFAARDERRRARRAAARQAGKRALRDGGNQPVVG
ncbi:MAG TPA: DUF6114 domain-containing protein [Nocardioides sp.]|uniref:DUF6114 domain-containing protein n=1 Tax=Nocardioides sp. TaxID=35761 RepID=UPI002ED8DAD9